jgi:excisionase family DNA binding protein
VTALGSVFAGIVATLFIALFAPPLAQIALLFGPAEYVSLMLLGLIVAVVLAQGSILAALGMLVLGLLLGTAAATRGPATPALTVRIDIDPLVDVVRRHVNLSARATRLIEGDFARMFRNPALQDATQQRVAGRGAPSDPVLTTQEAADLLGVSRPYSVARIEAGDIALHQQVGNQRRVLKSSVEAWHRREQARRRRAIGKLGDDLDGEIFAR